MKKFSLFLIALLVSVSFSFAKDLKDIKFAVVDMEQAILKSKEGLKYKKEMEEKLSYYKKQLEDLQKKYQEIDKQLKSPVLSEEGKKKKMEEKKKIEEKIRNLQVRATQELSKMKAEAEKKLIDKVKETVKKYAQKHKIDVVFVKALLAGVLYSSPKIDITEDIIREMNK